MISETETEEALGHIEGDTTETTDPTCGAPGTKTFTCTRCEKPITVNTEQPTGNHTWGDWTFIEPSVSANDKKSRKCKVCSKTEEEAIKIGDIGPAGGKIFYIDEAGDFDWNYLECNTDEKGISVDGINTFCFGYYRPDGTNTVVGGTVDAIGTGEANTKALVEKMGDTAYTKKNGVETTALYAAKVAYDYVQNEYDDWFLPSLFELKEIALQENNPELTTTNYFWSSSENKSYAEKAAYLNFNYDSYGSNDRSKEYYIRPIRAF